MLVRIESALLMSERFFIATNPAAIDSIYYSLPLSPLLLRIADTTTEALGRVKRDTVGRCHRYEVLYCGITVSKG